MASRRSLGAGAGGRLTLDFRACDRCGRCVAACERGAVKVGRTYLVIDEARCDGCGACARACPTTAIRLAAAASRTRPARPAPRPRKTAEPAGPAGSARGVERDDAPQARRVSVRARRASDRRASAPAPKTGARGGFQWTLLEAAATLSVTFSAFMVKEVVSASRGMAVLPARSAIAARVGVLALYYAAQVAVVVGLVRRRGGDTLSALGLRRREGGRGRAFASAALVLAGLVTTRLLASVYAFATREAGLMPSGGVDLRALFGGDAAGVLLAVLMVVLVGPVVEEAVFRGALLEGLAARLGAWPAIAVQAALFAAFHRSVWLLFPMFALGVALGWLAHERESLWPPIALHALYNAITVAAAFLAPHAG